MTLQKFDDSDLSDAKSLFLPSLTLALNRDTPAFTVSANLNASHSWRVFVDKQLKVSPSSVSGEGGGKLQTISSLQ